MGTEQVTRPKTLQAIWLWRWWWWWWWWWWRWWCSNELRDRKRVDKFTIKSTGQSFRS